MPLIDVGTVFRVTPHESQEGKRQELSLGSHWLSKLRNRRNIRNTATRCIGVAGAAHPRTRLCGVAAVAATRR